MSTPISLPPDQRSTDQDHDFLNETTPLLLSQTRSQEPANVEAVVVPIQSEVKSVGDNTLTEAKKWPRSTRWLILLCAFITSLTFGVTQAPILWVFRVMTCDAYYRHHPSENLSATSVSLTPFFPELFAPTANDIHIESDRCAIHAIDASTALSMALLGGSTTLFGVLNLFLTGNLIKRIGLRYALLVQLLFAAIRLFIQNIAVELGEDAGILLFQCSQIVSVIGGPSGYILVLNSYITEVVDHEARTAALGILQGNMLFGSASGFLLGGLVSDAFGIKAPFRLTFLLFLSSAAYAFMTLPSITPQKADPVESKLRPRRRGCGRLFGPLAVFLPKKFLGSDNIVRTEYGSLLLACGVFLGINATGYLPTLLQLYSMDEFGFTAKENGSLIFMYSVLRGLFLTIAFPRIIKFGRSWTIRNQEKARLARQQVNEAERLLPEHSSADQVSDRAPEKQDMMFTFDLQYARFSLVLDGLFTVLCSFVCQGWQMYLMATILPFAAGTGSAAKGTILQMVGNSASMNERTDALAGVGLIENIARLSTSMRAPLMFDRPRMLTSCQLSCSALSLLDLLTLADWSLSSCVMP